MPYASESDVPKVDKHLLKGSLQLDPWLIAVLACFTLFAWANWAKVAAPIIDVGREIEIPARIVDGQLLYRDVVSFYGPLAYYANALALRLFGHHLEVFYAVGLVLALLATLLFYRLAKRLTNTHWAALSTIWMLIDCAIGPGPFHFILPYSHGAVYAIVLCLLAINFLDCYCCTGKIRWLLLAAITCGIAGLAKQEYGVAALGGVLVGTNFYSPQNLGTRVVRSLFVVLAAVGSVILPLALLAQQVSWEQLYLWLLPIPKLGILNQSKMFQLSPVHTLYCWWSDFKVFFPTSLIVLVSVLAAHRLLKPRLVNSPRWFINIVELLVSIAISFCGIILLSRSSFFTFYSDFGIFKPLHFLSWSVPLLVVWFAINRPQMGRYKNAPLMWTLVIFLLLLNARWLFSINFYGLYAWPLILLFFVPLHNLHQRTGGLLWRYSLVCLLIAGSLNLSSLAQFRYAVQSSYGTFYTANTALTHALNQTINAITASGYSSVLVLPEGNILNFLTATHSPSRELTFFPTVFTTTKDEQDFIKRMQANPPDLIVYVPRTFPEWGYQTYGEFNPLVDQWITQQHRLVNTFPMADGAIRIYARD
ncbi:MAG: hypothetical protein RMX68_005250 [Aulosira sp. ZfuVER01]|nr:glycosyltransferase family 39 protein [Aulosira sp. ZfuVER01]MDZ8000776.1 glycosyltransferase family 39 protein [Aulosira sp. DedVER01a]MDZ8055085.1 glycosyltransferase family 39 protein [Aulosira sp. ZfuCHP01]